MNWWHEHQCLKSPSSFHFKKTTRFGESPTKYFLRRNYERLCFFFKNKSPSSSSVNFRTSAQPASWIWKTINEHDIRIMHLPSSSGKHFCILLSKIWSLIHEAGCLLLLWILRSKRHSTLNESNKDAFT